MAEGRHRQGRQLREIRDQQGTLRAAVVKVPEITIYFWIVKLLTTAMGESVSDFLVNDFNKYLGVLVGFILFAIAIIAQFRAKRYSTWLYWTAVSMVAVFGTMCADVLHVVIGLPYTVSFTLYAVLLAATFITWHRVEGTLDIHSVNTPRREVFYWATVIFTFAMGTAVGDLTAITVHLGYLSSAFLFVGMICLPIIAWRLGANWVATFWIAYVLTRPVGASFADYSGMAKKISGLGIGHGPTAAVLIVIVAAGIWFLKSSGKDEQQPRAVSPQGGDAPAYYLGGYYAPRAGYASREYSPLEEYDPGDYPQ
jgi:uncharacterized membrane-anchored protein